MLGAGVLVVGVLLPILGKYYRRHPQRFDQVQDFSFALIFVLIGVILFFNGWKLTPELLFTQWLLVESAICWIIKDIYK